jgi:hypothetical protein
MLLGLLDTNRSGAIRTQVLHLTDRTRSLSKRLAIVSVLIPPHCDLPKVRENMLTSIIL